MPSRADIQRDSAKALVFVLVAQIGAKNPQG
jgi:hypothetical protein